MRRNQFHLKNYTHEKESIKIKMAICNECDRRFDLWDDNDAAEFYLGHDCES